jgi:uncharacterized protein DUF3768
MLERLVMPAENSPERRTVAQLNDEFRQHRHDWYITSGAQALPDVPGLLQAVQDFNAFTPDNDPHGEHDFGSIAWYQEKTYWKIDYYDQALQYWHDPLAPDCRRVLTVLLASEY